MRSETSLTAPPTRTAATRRLLAALGLVVGLLAIAIGTAARDPSSPLPFVEIWCVVPIGVIVFLELRPALIALFCDTPLAQRRALQRLQRELNALPQTPHPLEARQGASDQPITANTPDITTPTDARGGTQRFPSRKRTQSAAIALVQELNIRYLDWLDDAAAAENAYTRWSHAPPEEKAQAFAVYVTALDREEDAARRYGQAVTNLKRLAAA